MPNKNRNHTPHPTGVMEDLVICNDLVIVPASDLDSKLEADQIDLFRFRNLLDEGEAVMLGEDGDRKYVLFLDTLSGRFNGGLWNKTRLNQLIKERIGKDPGLVSYDEVLKMISRVGENESPRKRADQIERTKWISILGNRYLLRTDLEAYLQEENLPFSKIEGLLRKDLPDKESVTFISECFEATELADIIGVSYQNVEKAIRQVAIREGMSGMVFRVRSFSRLYHASYLPELIQEIQKEMETAQKVAEGDGTKQDRRVIRGYEAEVIYANICANRKAEKEIIARPSNLVCIYLETPDATCIVPQTALVSFLGNEKAIWNDGNARTLHKEILEALEAFKKPPHKYKLSNLRLTISPLSPIDFEDAQDGTRPELYVRSLSHLKKH